MAEIKIGFVGLGIMGSGMAMNLLKAGHDLAVYNRTPGKAVELLEQGAKQASSPAGAALGRDIVMTILSDPPAVREVVLGDGGVLEGIPEGALLIDCSTVDPATTKTVYEAATAKGVRFMDCPVGGSKEAARRGELLLMVGGDDAIIDEARPVLDVIGKKLIHAGPVGCGTSLKLCFNLIVGHLTAALAESLVLGVTAGLRPEDILEALMSSGMASPYFETKGLSIIERDFSTNFSTRLMHKDLNLMMSTAYDLNVPLPVTAAAKELYAMAKGMGLAEEDMCSVVKVLEEAAGVEVRHT